MQIADIGSWKVLYLMWIIPLFSIMTADRGRRGSAQQVWPELLRTVMENCLHCYHSINLCTFNCFGADWRTHEGMDLIIRVIIVSSHAYSAWPRERNSIWSRNVTSNVKLDDWSQENLCLWWWWRWYWPFSPSVSWKTISEIIRASAMLCNESGVGHWDWDWIPGRSVESPPGVKRGASGLVSAGKTN